VSPYPFGADGNPVTASGACAIVPGVASLPVNCYLTVTSLAFRSWNHGLAATADPGASAAYGVWIYNGKRWYPNPTFPGATICPGGTVLWAGKLDYWLIGPGYNSTTIFDPLPPSTACRFDGANDEWEVFPKEAFYAGACYAYNNCWFFGSGGAVTRWDGTALVPVATGLGGPPLPNGVSTSPWLSGTVSGALASTDAEGNPFAVAVSSEPNPNQPAKDQPDQPDGSSAPQIFAGSGGALSPANVSTLLPGTNLTVPPSTNLVAVAFDAAGDGWVAGNPALNEIPGGPSVFPGAGTGTGTWLSPITTTGTVPPCPASSALSTSFPYSPTGTGTSYLWTAIAVLPGGTALAGGEIGGRAQGLQPVLVQVSCSGAQPVTTTFQPTPADATSGTAPIAADDGGIITAVAASASNDAWAASSPGQFTSDIDGNLGTEAQPPSFYWFTDGQPPDAPAGNDSESRPAITGTEPTIFVFPPPVVVPAPPAPVTVTKTAKPKTVVERELAPVYDIQAPKEGKLINGFVTLSVSFKVRRKVRIGIEALRGRKVVASSGIRTFAGRRGTLVLRLSTKAWPTSLKFIEPRIQP
jgi:hypothetical protein